MMFEAMAFKFYPIHIKHQTFNFKLKKALSSWDSAFFTIFYITYIKSLHLLGRIRLYSESGTSQIRLFKGEDFL